MYEWCDFTWHIYMPTCICRDGNGAKALTAVLRFQVLAQKAQEIFEQFCNAVSNRNSFQFPISTSAMAGRETEKWVLKKCQVWFSFSSSYSKAPQHFHKASTERQNWKYTLLGRGRTIFYRKKWHVGILRWIVVIGPVTDAHPVGFMHSIQTCTGRKRHSRTIQCLVCTWTQIISEFFMTVY